MVTKPRSPNYPAIDLSVAVERAKQLYGSVQRGGFTPEDAAKAWGYSGPTDRVRRALGALRQYGLIEAKKGSDARLTNAALTLALREPESKEFQAALREALRGPGLFNELIDSGRANDAVGALMHYLVVNKMFTKEGASTLVEVLKASLAFAGVATDEDTTELEESVPNEGEDDVRPATPASNTPLPPPGSITIPIPLSDGSVGTVTLPMGMTASDWRRLDIILKAYKPLDSEITAHVVSGSSEPAEPAYEGLT